jgi:hypothetical protein
MRAPRFTFSLALGSGLAGCPAVGTCPFGVTPFPGQTAVDPTGPFVFDAGGPLSADLPALADGIQLFSAADGTAVPFTFEVGSHTVSVTPTEPLAPDTAYVLQGISSTVMTPHHWSGFGLAETSTSFSTASDPQFLTVVWDGDGIVVVFSEPMDPASIEAGVVFMSAGVPIGAYEGPFDGFENAFRFALDPGVVLDQAAGIVLEADLRARTGEIVEAETFDPEVARTWTDFEAFFRGMPTCEMESF